MKKAISSVKKKKKTGWDFYTNFLFLIINGTAWSESFPFNFEITYGCYPVLSVKKDLHSFVHPALIGLYFSVASEK